MQNPEWEDVNSFQHLETATVYQPELPSAKEGSIPHATPTLNFTRHMPADMSELNMVMGIMESEIGKLEGEVKENHIFQILPLNLHHSCYIRYQ